MQPDQDSKLRQLQSQAEDLRKWVVFYEKAHEEYRLKQYEKYLTNALTAIDRLKQPTR
ncbi:hypothetical protein [Cohnella sp. JJ-181]|uniref:hypothetical protein n=1 Tax=Cohnella rhizoplanae TaxID=2974897 RepID=UPI0022FFBE12|nr:hypothetical protein [Cohnella sp. JJ-181]CAI6084965.1 hypothetical protein COHCIP112018_04511 [Cohnella sp. JJ-181]